MPSNSSIRLTTALMRERAVPPPQQGSDLSAYERDEMCLALVMIARRIKELKAQAQEAETDLLQRSELP